MLSPNPWMILPFGLLLGMIALGPLLFSEWWARHYPKVALALGAVTVAYYFAELRAYERVLEVGHEYISFILLIGSLFVVSGGIHIKVKGEATPWVNVVYLFIGALLANLLGTTGASMLLIRPWIRMNKYRITGHHIVFFIFIVSNVGGCLTPIGDPPLFLGFLKGIPFWWVAANCWPMWAVAVGFLLAAFYFVDLRNYRRAPKSIRNRLAEPGDEWSFDGLWNLVCLAVILGAVFIHHPPLLREGLMAAAAMVSWFGTGKRIHEANDFNLHPIKEVAILFVGIFATMMPALDWLEHRSGSLITPSPTVYYWASGTLSSVLDNAPTYLSFFSATIGLATDQHVIQQAQLWAQHQLDPASLGGPQSESIRNTIATLQKYYAAELARGAVDWETIQVAFLLGNVQWSKLVLAISIGSVFFGANTYIGNGPNFMVKAIAEQQKVHAPDFVTYIFKYALVWMLPMLLLIWAFFFLR